MAELKTKKTTQSPREFLKGIEPEQKRNDALALLSLFQKVAGEKAVMWGAAIVGFGDYHYKSARSSQEGDWFLVGFSPRKANLTLYIMHGNKENPDLEKLGKYKVGGGCLYINKLSDVDEKLLARLVKKSLEYMKKVAKEGRYNELL